MTDREEEIKELCLLYDKRVLAQELMIAYDQIALLQEFISEQTKRFREEVEERPSNCRNQLREDGRPYPRSGCYACKDGGLKGCPYDRY